MRLKYMIILCLLASACNSAASQDVANAQKALTTYFTQLNEGSYEQAAKIYGGGYEELANLNPEVAPGEIVKLLENACETNGFQCLKVKSVEIERQIADNEWVFLVEFEDPNGSLFTLGPCCGADSSEMPPQTKFDFSVKKTSQGEYQVMGLPVFMP